MNYVAEIQRFNADKRISQLHSKYEVGAFLNCLSVSRREVSHSKFLAELFKEDSFHGQSTLFNVLGIERSENRHSAFLQWLLNPKSSHGLGDSPLKKFLALVATLASDENKCYYYQVRQHLISGNYTLQVENSK
jgi:hypothetical protein